MPHIVLLGDSVFDNAAYVAGGPDVAAQLRQQAHGRTVTLCAVDGATTTTFPPQVGRIPADATNLVLSLGGNDALGHFDLLERPVSSMAQGLTMLADAADAFERRYRACIHALQPRRLPLTVCTIYNGSFDDRRLARLVRTALAVFNVCAWRSSISCAPSICESSATKRATTPIRSNRPCTAARRSSARSSNRYNSSA